MPEALLETEPILLAPPGWPAWPERTLFDEIAPWTYDYLRQPDGPDAGDHWRFTQEQALLVAYWFAFDERARWLYRRGTIRMMKGWGKDPIGAVLACIEIGGPSRIVRGHAERHPAPWVQLSAVSREQTRSTMRLFPSLISPKLETEQQIEVNKQVVYARGGAGVIESVTSSPDALEGGRTTLVIKNETQNWRQSNQGHEMAAVIDGNIAKSRDGAARQISFCNAHVPGEDTVGEREHDAYMAILAGRSRSADVLYYAREAPADTRLDDEGSLRHALTVTRGDSTWLDVDRLEAEVYDPQTSPSEARRKYLNQIVASEDAWVAPHEWNACRTDAILADGEMITLGFDGSKTGDHTALVATRVEDAITFTLGVWDPDLHGGEIPRMAVDAAVAGAFEHYDVVGFYSDLHPFESYVDRWRDDFGADLCVAASDKHPIAWDMRARQMAFTKAAERFHDGIIETALLHDGDTRLSEHVYNARRRPNRHGVSFGKESRDSSRKVDAAAAAVLSRLAFWDYTALPRSRQRRQRTGKAHFV